MRLVLDVSHLFGLGERGRCQRQGDKRHQCVFHHWGNSAGGKLKVQELKVESGVWEFGSLGVWEFGSLGVWEFGPICQFLIDFLAFFSWSRRWATFSEIAEKIAHNSPAS